MPAAHSVDSQQDSAPAKDPVLNLRRDHTYLEMLAEAFRRLAQSLRDGKPTDPEKVREGIELHRRFLTETHYHKEELLDRELAKLPGQPFRKTLAECEGEHAAGRKAAATFARELDEMLGGDKEAARSLAGHLEREADRWIRHMHHEEEDLYARLQDRIPAASADVIATGMRKIRADSAALEERLVSWTSSFGASSD
jgi:hemerythrin-like domain-containing protein